MKTTNHKTQGVAPVGSSAVLGIVDVEFKELIKRAESYQLPAHLLRAAEAEMADNAACAGIRGLPRRLIRLLAEIPTMARQALQRAARLPSLAHHAQCATRKEKLLLFWDAFVSIPAPGSCYSRVISLVQRCQPYGNSGNLQYTPEPSIQSSSSRRAKWLPLRHKVAGIFSWRTMPNKYCVDHLRPILAASGLVF